MLQVEVHRVHMIPAAALVPSIALSFGLDKTFPVNVYFTRDLHQVTVLNRVSVFLAGAHQLPSSLLAPPSTTWCSPSHLLCVDHVYSSSIGVSSECAVYSKTGSFQKNCHTVKLHGIGMGSSLRYCSLNNALYTSHSILHTRTWTMNKSIHYLMHTGYSTHNTAYFTLTSHCTLHHLTPLQVLLSKL